MRLVAAQNVLSQPRMRQSQPSTRGYTTGVDLESRRALLYTHPVMPGILIMELYPLEGESFVRM